MNYTIIIGNLVKEPEKVEKATKTMCKMVVAVNEKYTDSNGERITNFFNVIVWGNLAENCLNYLKKGSKVAITGNLQNRRYMPWDRVTNENEIIISNPNNRSATIAISTSVASTLLAIATRAGVTFATSGAMDTFLYHFVGLETSTEIIGSLSALIKNTKDGVVKLSRSLIDSITRGISQSYYKRLDKSSKS